MTLYFIQAYYLRTSRQVRLLDIEAKAPLYTHSLETIQGISTIRAFRWGPQFQKTSQHLLNESQKPVYMLYCVQQWLTLVLDLVVGVIAVMLIAMVTSLKDKFSAASIGQSQSFSHFSLLFPACMFHTAVTFSTVESRHVHAPRIIVNGYSLQVIVPVS